MIADSITENANTHTSLLENVAQQEIWEGFCARMVARKAKVQNFISRIKSAENINSNTISNEQNRN